MNPRGRRTPGAPCGALRDRIAADADTRGKGCLRPAEGAVALIP